MAEARDPEFITTKEFLARHRGRISESTLRRYIAAGAIPFAQAAGRKGRILIPENALSLVMSDPSSRNSARTGD